MVLISVTGGSFARDASITSTLWRPDAVSGSHPHHLLSLPIAQKPPFRFRPDPVVWVRLAEGPLGSTPVTSERARCTTTAAPVVASGGYRHRRSTPQGPAGGNLVCA